MNKQPLSICLAFAFLVASAVAQMAPRGSQGDQTSPSTSQPSTSQPSQYPSQGAGQTSPDQNATTQNQAGGEHTIKGCVQSQGGSYILETRKGKEVALSGQDVSSHVGHEVALKGTWEGGGHATSSTAAGSTGSTAGGESKTFDVSSVKMISESCKGKGGTGSTSSPSGHGTQPPQ
ncbi:MAG: hypothetical protein J2P13_11880 [Acidobacteria bacterium]|nr:hypothetical protein [Acidobacteriota bacterium]